VKNGSGAALLGRSLARNLLAGARLALFLPVRALDFRVSGAQCFALILSCLALWVALGVVQQGVPGDVDAGGFAVALAAVPVLLGVCVLAASLFGEARLALAFAVVLSAGVPAFLLVDYLAELGWDRVAPAHAAILDWVVFAWVVGIAARGQILLTGWRGRRSALGLVLFAALAAALLEIAPRAQVWVAAADEDSDSELSLTQEEVFQRQGRLLDERLAALEPERRGVPDLYFVGVAADSEQDTFYSEVESIKELLDERFDTEDRSILLVNNPATLTEQPVATVSNLRATLAFLGATIDPEEDIVLLHIATHGSSDYRLKFEMPPLELAQLTPSALARMLADSGIKWKVIVISACFAGGYVEPLKDENTLVITAADATHSSFGCSYDSDYTWFSEALYDEALRETFSFAEAFEAARKTVAQREKEEGFPPSNPQISMGSAIRQKLAALEKRLSSEDSGEPQKNRVIRVRAIDNRTVLVMGR
jgi:hypothetical protein